MELSRLRRFALTWSISNLHFGSVRSKVIVAWPSGPVSDLKSLMAGESKVTQPFFHESKPQYLTGLTNSAANASADGSDGGVTGRAPRSVLGGVEGTVNGRVSWRWPVCSSSSVSTASSRASSSADHCGADGLCITSMSHVCELCELLVLLQSIVRLRNTRKRRELDAGVAVFSSPSGFNRSIALPWLG